jgi:hypothetical protein
LPLRGPLASSARTARLHRHRIERPEIAKSHWRFLRWWSRFAKPARQSVRRRSPVEFLQICGETSSFIIPGTNTCVDANQIVANQIGAARQASTAFTGVAMSEALVEPFVPDHANFAVSIHEASFENKFAVGLSGLLRLQGNLMLSAGIAVGRDAGSVVSGETTPSTTGQQSYRRGTSSTCLAEWA